METLPDVVAPLPSLVPQQAILAELAGLSTDQLKVELARVLRITAESLVRLALVVKTLEDRGEDLSDIRVGLLPYLRLIAAGQLLPEVVVRFAGAPALIRVIGALPVQDQRRLAAGEPIPLYLRRGDGTVEHRLADPLAMTRDQVQQAFARDHIRDQAEQILVLESRLTRPAKTVRESDKRIGNIRVDRGRGGIVVRRTLIPLADLLEAVAELRGLPPENDDGAEWTTVPVRMTFEEHRRLKMLAAERGAQGTIQGTIRDALWASGVLSKEERS